jgi:hypothetical protein
MKTSTWAWILVGGGAFTVIAGWLSARARAQDLSTLLPAGLVIPDGVSLTTEDVNFLNRALAAKRAERGANFVQATWVQGVNGILVQYALYRSNFNAWWAQIAGQSASVARPSKDMTFSQFAEVYGG